MYTNRQMLEALRELDDNQLDLSATVRFNGEYYGISYTDNTDNDEDAPFDEIHPFFQVNEDENG